VARIICKLPNASEVINGIKFISHKLGMISEEIEDEVAQEFLKIKGYVLHGKGASKDDSSSKSETEPSQPAQSGGASDPADPAQS